MLLGACSGGGDDAPSIPTAPTAAPPSVALDVAPDTVHETSTADLNWSSTDASECVASGGWSGLKSLTGSESTGALTSTTAYTLTCTGPGGTAGQTVTANVTPANTVLRVPRSRYRCLPPLSTLVGRPHSPGAPVTPAAAPHRATGAASSQSRVPASTGPLTVSASFALTCTGGGGAATQTVNVAVNAPGAPPPPSIALSATPSTIASGGTTTLSWTASNVTTCTATGGWIGAKAFSGSEARVGLVATTTFALTCSGAGGTASQAVTVNVTPATPPPTVALSAVPNAIVQGASASLTWSSTNATACTASGDWTGTKTTQGTQSTGTLTTARTYSYGLSCTGPGGVASRSATVVVSATPPAPSVSPIGKPRADRTGRHVDFVVVCDQRVDVHRFRRLERCQGDLRFADDVRAFTIDDVHTRLYRFGRDDDPQRQRDRNACDAAAHGDAYGSTVRHRSGRIVDDELDDGQRHVLRRQR